MSGSESANKVRDDSAEERRLVEAAQRDIARFADVYDNYFETVYAYASRRVGDRAAAEDLTAEVFHRALRGLPRFKWTGAPFAAWLFRIASNLIKDRARREAREKTDDVSQEQLTESDSTGSRRSTLGETNKRQLHEELEEVERNVKLFQLLNKLSADQRSVLTLRFAEELSIGEIAAKLERSEGAIKQLQFRALRNLRAMLDGEAGSESL